MSRNGRLGLPPRVGVKALGTHGWWIFCAEVARSTAMRRFVLILGLLLTPAPLSADELRLANGDRYTGEVVSLEAGKLRFKTRHGNLDVPWSDVTSLTVDAPVLVRVDPATAPASM